MLEREEKRERERLREKEREEREKREPPRDKKDDALKNEGAQSKKEKKSVSAAHKERIVEERLM